MISEQSRKPEEIKQNYKNDIFHLSDNKRRISIMLAAHQFYRYKYDLITRSEIWGNGACVVLKHLYHMMGIDIEHTSEKIVKKENMNSYPTKANHFLIILQDYPKHPKKDNSNKLALMSMGYTATELNLFKRYIHKIRANTLKKEELKQIQQFSEPDFIFYRSFKDSNPFSYSTFWTLLTGAVVIGSFFYPYA